jgi:hypothetical protein
MKKTIAMAMLLLFLFNLGGYYMVFSVLKLQAGQELSHNLDLQNVIDEESVVVKVPLHLPYPINSTGFERVKGTIKSGGRYFQMLKQKIENDTLTLVLVQDKKSNQIEDAIQTLDQQQSNEQSPEATLNFSIKLVQDFIALGISILPGTNPWYREIGSTGFLSKLDPAELDGINPPPKI